MTLVDANLLLYAKDDSCAQHQDALTWLEFQLNGRAPVGLPWHSLLGFVRLISNPRVFAQPLTVAEAWEQVEEWLDRPNVWIPGPTERHRELLGRLLRGRAHTADLVSDAHLAALAQEHGLVLCSTDGDFARFPDLRWLNPLDASARRSGG